jgi:hypothetical protein
MNESGHLGMSDDDIRTIWGTSNDYPTSLLAFKWPGPHNLSSARFGTEKIEPFGSTPKTLATCWPGNFS